MFIKGKLDFRHDNMTLSIFVKEKVDIGHMQI
jgi:hypothetical protein